MTWDEVDSNPIQDIQDFAKKCLEKNDYFNWPKYQHDQLAAKYPEIYARLMEEARTALPGQLFSKGGDAT